MVKSLVNFFKILDHTLAQLLILLSFLLGASQLLQLHVKFRIVYGIALVANVLHRFLHILDLLHQLFLVLLAYAYLLVEFCVLLVQQFLEVVEFVDRTIERDLL